MEPERDRRPVIAWAVLGAAFVVLSLYVWASWLLSPDASPVKIATDEVPTLSRVVAVVTQIVCVLAVVVAGVFVTRQSRRLGRLSMDAMLLIAWVFVVWQDPIVNYVRPTFFYNNYYVNLGGWAPHIPGWISPRAAQNPEPIFMIFFGYAGMSVPIVIGICAGLRMAKRRRPEMGKLTLVLLAVGLAAIADTILELIWVRTGQYSYAGAISKLSIDGGSRYQFPIYEAVFWGCVWTAVVFLRISKDDKGLSVVERGSAGLAMSSRKRSLVRLLAVIAFLNVVFGVYNVAWTWISLYVDKQPSDVPAYIRNDVCGNGTPFPCPNPRSPIPLPDSPAQQ